MNRIGAAELGSSQRAGKGFPQLLSPQRGYTLRRVALATLAVVAFGVAIVATSTAIEGHADAGVEIDENGRVVAVSPTGFAWRDGVRPGQLVVSSTKSDSDEGWQLVVVAHGGHIESREAPVLEALRGSLLFGLLGLGAGCLAVVFLRTNRKWALPAACLALLGASFPLFLANHALGGPTLLLAAGAPAAWASWRLRGRPWVGILVGGASIALLVAWWNGFVTGSPDVGLEEARRAVALGGTGLLMAERAAESRPARPLRLLSLQALWIVLGAGFITGALALVYFASFPAPIIAIAVVLWLLAAPGIRAAVGRRVEHAVMSDLRAQVAADVAEEERGRLARELHDAPLQELSALIRRLELVPGTQEETQSLQGVANQLRSMAIDLRPPMLDDLGLGAALEFLADQHTSPETAVVANFADNTGLDPASRPPEAVEFALYRISREAVTNALRHAKARNISITGRIARDSIDLLVSDDGVGVDEEARRRATGSGRLGLASMRRRAQAIGAELAVEGTRAGTRVTVAWRA